MLLKYYFHYVIRSSNIILRDNFIRKLDSNNSIKTIVKLCALFFSWKKIIKFLKTHQIMYGSIIRFYYRRKMKSQILNIFSMKTLRGILAMKVFLQNFVLPHQAVKF